MTGLYLSCFLLVLGADAGGVDEGWEEIAVEEGIRITSKDVPGLSLPIFRGVGIVNAGLVEILTVFYDIPRHTEWRHRCSESEVLERKNDFDQLLYTRTDAPWPVKDRDVVLHARTVLEREKGAVWVHFDGVQSPLKGEIEDAIRMPRLRGFYYLVALTPGQTEVTYQVESDPGGWLPKWVARLATKSLPLKTIANLRTQVARTRGEYADVVEAWRKTHGFDGLTEADFARRQGEPSGP